VSSVSRASVTGLLVDTPLWGWSAACLALAGASLLARHSLTYDAWSWLDWGREIDHLGLHTATGTSWKPLPSLVDALLAPAGTAAAPSLWLWLARAGGLMALVSVLRLGARLGGALAGTGATVLFVLTAHAGSAYGVVDFLAVGWSDLLTVAAVLLAADRHLARRPGHAAALLALASLVRPEAFAFLVVYAAVAWRGPTASRAGLALAVAGVPALWIGPDYLGSGELLRGSTRALHDVPAAVARARHPGLLVVSYLRSLLILPTKVALAGGLVAAVAGRDRRLSAVAGLFVAWTLVVALMAELGYPGLERFLATPVALACVLAGVALARAIGRLPGPGARRLGVAAAAVVVAAFTPGPLGALGQQLRFADRQVAEEDALPVAVARARSALTDPRCRGVAAGPLDVPLVAWYTGHTAVTITPRAGDVVFSAPEHGLGRRPALTAREERALRLVAVAGAWRVEARCGGPTARAAVRSIAG
jgi:hypothetical protein